MAKKIKVLNPKNKYIPLEGQVFGRLTVISRCKKPRHNSATYWNCKCACGIEKAILGHNLRRLDVVSCGCQKKEYLERITLPAGLANFNKLYSQLLYRAKKKKIQCTIEKSDLFVFYTSNCFYCNSSPRNVTSRARANGDFIYTGIDRINCEKDYSIDNVVPCCYGCNILKMDQLTQSETLVLVAQLKILRNKEDIWAEFYVKKALKSAEPKTKRKQFIDKTLESDILPTETKELK